MINVGGLAPGMNAAARAAVRLGLDRGHTMLGISGVFEGLVNDDVVELKWGDVEGWTSRGGAELGISRQVPTVRDLYAIGRGMERHGIDGLLIIGGWDAFNAAHTMHGERERYPAFQIPMIVLPATIDNDIPNSELSVGADSALNLIVDSIDRIRQSGTAARRCFVVEVMGGYCGYLAVMGGLSGGAVRVYLHEEGITLKQLAAGRRPMVDSFRVGQRLFLAVRNERASEMYTRTSSAGCSSRRARVCSTPARSCSATSSRAATRPRSTGSWPPGWPRTASTTCPIRSRPASRRAR